MLRRGLLVSALVSVVVLRALLSAVPAGAPGERAGAAPALCAPGTVSVVAACRDRAANLRRAVASWLRVRGACSLTVVDWDGRDELGAVVREALHGAGATGAELRAVAVLRVSPAPGGPRIAWALTRAFNAAFAADKALRSHGLQHGGTLSMANASSGPPDNQVLFKADCDVLASPDLVAALRAANSNGSAGSGADSLVPPGSYVNVPWPLQRSPKELHLSGSFLARAADVHRAGGMDERMRGWGPDDQDLYRRMALRRIFPPVGALEHIPHGDMERLAAYGLSYPKPVSASRIVRMLAVAPPWDPASATVLRIDRVETSGDAPALVLAEAQPVHLPADLDGSIPPEALRKIDAQACAEALKFYVLGSGPEARRAFCTLPRAARTIRSLVAAAPERGNDTVLLTARLSGSLVRRIEGLSCALRRARELGWHLRAVWEPDADCASGAEDVLDAAGLDLWDRPPGPEEAELLANRTLDFPDLASLDSRAFAGDPAWGSRVRDRTRVWHASADPGPGCAAGRPGSLEPSAAVRQAADALRLRLPSPYDALHLGAGAPDGDPAAIAPAFPAPAAFFLSADEPPALLRAAAALGPRAVHFPPCAGARTAECERAAAAALLLLAGARRVHVRGSEDVRRALSALAVGEGPEIVGIGGVDGGAG
ncbi:hypothetical protein DFJ74DRAFT_737401 [Hyaloraphidium curvatum]|nr:hypothetical protein DFJ74DRAFT_737401 [Hyaloraphidium curvatum]